MTIRQRLDHVTLLCVDTTRKVALAERAMDKCLEQCAFADAKLLTTDTSRRNSVEIAPVPGIEGYSNFCIRDLHAHFDTSHCLLIQSDGYILNPCAWTDRWLKYDYIGAPWHPAGIVGNGGFSLRSRKLCKTLALHPFGDSPHPEDNYICWRHRKELTEGYGINFAGCDTAKTFAYEGRVWPKIGGDWVSSPTAWNGQFGFHSWLTKLPDTTDRPSVFHHSGDWGDIIYSLATIKALGGGVLFLSPDNRFPFPNPTRLQPNPEWAANIVQLCEQQDYIWRCQYTPTMPHNVDFDLNAFRAFYRARNPDNFTSLFRLHLKAMETDYPEDKPWLTVDKPVEVPLRPIIISRTSRYHNDSFPWQRFVRKYQDRMAFLGTVTEAGEFQQRFKSRIPHIVTPTLMDAARLVAGAKVVVANQSSVMALALGLGKNVVQEVWVKGGNPNCKLKRANAVYAENGLVDIPSSWA